MMKLYTKTANEIDELKVKKQQLLIEKAGQEDAKRRIREMEDFLKSERHDISEYDEKLVRKYIKKIKVYEDKFSVTFKSEISVDVERASQKPKECEHLKCYKTQPSGASLGSFCFYAQKPSYQANLKPFNDSFFYR
ncbi:hypothetical protein ACMZ8A_06400 [Gardnerella swidsinskii]|uniref:hypothetical protein n=1 Tax=Gardnerella swidsinskii TaxID=2792979 RepID=UPI0039EE88CD